MNSNSICKFDTSNEISYMNTMGLIDTKAVESTANVNKIESKNIDPHLTNILLLIIFLIWCGYILYKAYEPHLILRASLSTVSTHSRHSVM